ncbi:alanine racemase [Patescibacteria group bacterium]|nr:alanine racemase [Patescibacteria group bacterium]
MLTWINIDLGAIGNNLRRIHEHIDEETRVIAVVKANAYGHGLTEVGNKLWQEGVDMLAVSTVDEAIALRIAKIKVPILVIGYTQPSEYQRVIEHSLRITVFSKEEIETLAQVAESAHQPVRVHLKIDTGMHRLGINPAETTDYVNLINQKPYLILEAVFSHFAEADNVIYSRNQIKEIESALFQLQQIDANAMPMVHLAASKSIIKYPEAHFDAVRPGIALYGLEDTIPGLLPALRWSTKIVQVRRVNEGASVGYGLTYKTKRISSLAVIPVGYADGYPRSLSNKAQVLINGKRVGVVGRICMNQAIIDVTGLNAKVGEQVVLIGKSVGDIIRAQDLARWAGTNPHEIVARISPYIFRNFHELKEDEFSA